MEKGRIEFDDPTFRPLLIKAREKAIDDGLVIDMKTDRFLQIGIESTLDATQMPIDMIIHCPSCGMQHVDKPEPEMCKCGHAKHQHTFLKGGLASCTAEGPKEGNYAGAMLCKCLNFTVAWDNPPHRSHKCHGCGIVFRTADVPTNGVAEIKTRGEHDTWPEAR